MPAAALLWLVAAFALGGCSEADEGREARGPSTETGSVGSGCRQSPASIQSGYGSPGSHAVEVSEIGNPEFPTLGVTLYRPTGVDAPPLILVGHGNGLSEPLHYARLLHHIASRGYAAAFIAHQFENERHEDRYRALWTGFRAIVDQQGDRLDLDRVGFVGHSYGAGALPRLAHRVLVDEKLGSRGALMLSMAPWYALEMTPTQWAELPLHLEVLILSFEDDEVTDHRIAIAQYETLPVNRKTYLLVRSDAHEDCQLRADHSVPQSSGLGGRDDALDEYAVFRMFDALAASAFFKDPEGARISNGKGNPDQLAMGFWADGTPVSPLDYSADPAPTRPQSLYLFKQDDRDAWRAYPDAVENPTSGARSRADDPAGSRSSSP